ncbi:MAG TPA: cell division protein FtsQ/DivIB, partial [Beijerinckiaceae bacterium]|nr:cell division protein FtsQ/DivIB [Beijerinckiaceae bacterium]
ERRARGHRLPRAAARRAAARRFDLPRGLGSFVVICFLSAITATGIVAGGHYDRFKAEYGSVRDIAARMLGMRVASVAVIGNRELSVEEVFLGAAIPATASLPFLDIGSVQNRLKSVPLIADASVRKLYPDKLAIQITERSPFALWQLDGQVKLVSADGTAIDVLRDDRFVMLPHVVGPGANKRVKEYVGILLEVPELADQVRAGTLVGERRWTLKLKNGVDVKLPEDEPARALARLAEVDRDSRLLSKDIIGVDLRQPDRIVVRLSEEAAQARNELFDKKIDKLKRRS